MRVFASIGALLVANSAVNAAFSPGDIVVNNFSEANIVQYDASGTPLRTFAGTGFSWEGASFTPELNLVTTYRSGVDIFSPDGLQITSFPCPGIIFGPGDVSVFSDGVLAVSDQGNHIIREYSQSGLLIRSLDLGGNQFPFGNTVSPSNLLWVSMKNAIVRVNEDGTGEASFTVTFRAGDLVVDPADETLWVTDTLHSVYHLSSSADVLGTFDVATSKATGIALSPDDQSIYVTGEGSNSMYKYSKGGTFQSSFVLNAADPLFISVITPEPVSLGVVSLGGLGLCRRKR